MKKILLVLALVVGGLALAPASPTSALFSTSHTDCSQSAGSGNRVCFDETTIFGPVILIYSTGSTLFTSFGVQNAAPGCNAFIATAAEWQPSANTQTAIPAAAGRCPSGATPQTYDGSAGCTPLVTWGICVPSAANHDLLEWFVNDTTVEFVWVN